MVGNAVPPRLAWYLAIQMKKAFADQMTISKEEKSQVQQTIKQVPIIKIAEQYPEHHWCEGDLGARRRVQVSP